MHEHKQNQCKRKVKNRKNVVGLIIFCITVGIVFLYAYYQNLRKEIDARQKWLETEKKAVGRYLDWHTGILLETDGKMGIYRKESGKLIYKEKADSVDGYLGMYLFLMGKYPLYTGEAGWICMECEKLYGLYERKIKTGFILCA